MSRRIALALAAVLLLAGCNKDKEIEPPAELVDIRPSIGINRLWSAGVGGGGERLRLALIPAIDGDTLYAAGRNGVVEAYAAATGRTRWRVDTRLELAAGPGAGGGIVALGTNDGVVVALDAADGKQRWNVRVSGEVLAPPLVAGDRVIVRTVDGRMRALAVTDGREFWLVEDTVPRLSLRGTAAPVVSGDTIVCGFDNGKILAVSLASGEMLWQTQLDTPSGRTELERLADVDAAVQIAGDDIYAVGYQGRVAMLALDSGQIWWGREASSYRGLDIDDDQVYVAAADGTVLALRRRDGSVVWQQEGLARRGLSTPAVDGGAVVVGDFEGYLHWLDRGDGHFVARERLGGAPIAALLEDQGRLYVLDVDGKLAAYGSADATGR